MTGRAGARSNGTGDGANKVPHSTRLAGRTVRTASVPGARRPLELLHGVAAVDDEGRAVHVARLVRREERHGGRHLVGPARATDRRVLGRSPPRGPARPVALQPGWTLFAVTP